MWYLWYRVIPLPSSTAKETHYSFSRSSCDTSKKPNVKLSKLLCSHASISVTAVLWHMLNVKVNTRAMTMAIHLFCRYLVILDKWKIWRLMKCQRIVKVITILTGTWVFIQNLMVIHSIVKIYPLETMNVWTNFCANALGRCRDISLDFVALTCWWR